MRGIVNAYNGEYGTIVTKDDLVIDFSKEDISFNKKINVGDFVEFRLEERFPDIKLAKNIIIIK